MTHRIWTKRGMLAAIAASALAISSQPILAQNTPTATPLPTLVPTAIAPTSLIELRGVVSAQDATTLSIGSQMIDISGALVGEGVGVGQRVRVRAALAGPNLWRAQLVELFTGSDMNAPLPNSGAGTPTSTPFPMNAPSVGTPTATPLPFSAPPAGVPGAGDIPFVDEFELVGTLDAVNGQTIIVSGLPISIVGAEIKTTLVAGMPVEVHVRMVNNVLTAREVDDEDDLIVDGQFTGAPVSADSAIAIMRTVLPNASVREIELERRADGSPIWEIHTTDNQEVYIDAQTGVVLAIELSDQGDDDHDRDDDLDDDTDESDSDDHNDDGSSGRDTSDDDDDGDDDDDDD